MTNHILNISLGEMQALALELISFCLRSKFLYEHLLEKQKDKIGMWSFLFNTDKELDSFLASETPDHENISHFQPWIRPLCHVHYGSTQTPHFNRVELQKPNYLAVEKLIKQTRWIPSTSELFFPKELKSNKREQKNTILFFQICVRAKLDTLYEDKFVFFEQHFMWEKTKDNYFSHVFPFSCYIGTDWVKENDISSFSFGSFKLREKKINSEKTMKKNEFIENRFNQSVSKRFQGNKK